MEYTAAIPRKSSGVGSSKPEARQIIFVNRYFHPDLSATSQMLSGLAFALAGDHPVRVVASRQLYQNPDAALPAEETIAGVAVRRVPTSRFGRGNLLGRAADYATFYLAAAAALAGLARAGDIIVAKTDPPLISVVAASVAVVRGCTLVNWIQDLFPEVAVALGVRGVGWAAPALRRLRDWSLRRAAANVVLGELMSRRLQALGVPAAGIRVIANWADGESIKPLAPEENPLREEWGLEGRFVVGYSGNLGRAHEFDTILGAAALLRDDAGIAFLFVGAGAQFEAVKGRAEAGRLGNVLFKPYQPGERLGFSLNVPDLHLVCLRPSLEGLIVPSKFYGVAAVGRPTVFVGDGGGEIAGILASIGCGLSVRVGDAWGLADAIRRLRRDPALCRRMGERARRGLEERFDRKLAVAAWKELFAHGGR
jgi:colanic acid biosynthesis glycosyl transferase WcaI